MATPMVKWALRAAVFPAAVVGYITIAGLTGFCPNCTDLLNSGLGRRGSGMGAGAVQGSIGEMTVYRLEGEPVSLSKFVGKPTIIDVWATYCPPCLEQRKILHGLDSAFVASVNIVSLSRDWNPKDVAAF